MNTKRILLMFALLFQMLAVHTVADYTGPWIVEPTQSVFDRDVAALPGTRQLNRSPAIHHVERE